MSDKFNWRRLNRFPILNLESASLMLTEIDNTGLEKFYQINNIDPKILEQLSALPAIAYYCPAPNGISWDSHVYLTVRLEPLPELIHLINQTLHAIKHYDMYSVDGNYYIRDYNLGQVSELTGIYPLLCHTGKMIDLSQVFTHLTDKAKNYLQNIYHEKVFVKFPLPRDIEIEWSEI